MSFNEYYYPSDHDWSKMMTELKPINFGINKFCVPAVSTDECAAVITSINGKQEIRAVNVPDIIKAFKKLRFDIEEQSVPARTLYGVLSSLSSKDGNYLILVPRHIVAIKVENGNIQLIDNASKEPLDASASARLTQSVDKVFKITEKAQPVLLSNSILVERDTYLYRLNIYRVAHYVNPEDNTKYSLGYIRYDTASELQQIIEAIKERND